MIQNYWWLCLVDYAAPFRLFFFSRGKPAATRVLLPSLPTNFYSVSSDLGVYLLEFDAAFGTLAFGTCDVTDKAVIWRCGQ